MAPARAGARPASLEVPPRAAAYASFVRCYPHGHRQWRGSRPPSQRSLNMEGFAAAAAALLVRISEDEARLHLLFDVVHLRA